MFQTKTIITILAVLTATITLSTSFFNASALELSDIIPEYNYDGAEFMFNTAANEELIIEPVNDLNVLVVYENNHQKGVFVLTGLIKQETDYIHNYFQDLAPNNQLKQNDLQTYLSYNSAKVLLNTDKDQELQITPVEGLNALAHYENNGKDEFSLKGFSQQEDQSAVSLSELQ